MFIFGIYLLTSVFTWSNDDRKVRSRPKGGASMPGLRALIPWIEQGTENFKDTTRRAVGLSTLADARTCTLQGFITEHARGGT